MKIKINKAVNYMGLEIQTNIGGVCYFTSIGSGCKIGDYFEGNVYSRAIEHWVTLAQQARWSDMENENLMTLSSRF
jgi:hypothetical protein